MTDYPLHEKENAALAALCYLPFFFINFVLPVYILLKKDSRYLRFHAWQSLTIVAIHLVVSTIWLIIFIPVWFAFFFGSISPADSGFTTFFLLFPLIWLLMFVYMTGFTVLSFYLLYTAYTGKEARVPLLTNFALGRI